MGLGVKSQDVDELFKSHEIKLDAEEVQDLLKEQKNLLMICRLMKMR